MGINRSNSQIISKSSYFPHSHDMTIEMVNFLNTVHNKLSKSLDYNKTIKQLGKLAVPKIADWFMIDLLEDGLVKQVAIINQNKEYLKIGKKLRKDKPVNLEEKFGIGHVIRSGKTEFYPTVSVKNLKKLYPNIEHYNEAKKTYPLSIIIVPVKVQNKTYGAFTFATTRESNRTYSELDVKLAEDFAHSAALALQNAILYKEAQDSRTRYEHLFQGINEAVLIANHEGIYIEANPAAKKMLDITDSDLGSMRVGDLNPGEGSYGREIFEQLKIRKHWESEFYIKSKTGRLFYVDLRAQEVKLPEETIYSIVLHDLTESKKAFETNARLAAIVSSSDEAIVVQSLSGTITSWNRGAKKLYGYEATEVIGKNVQLLFPENKLHELKEISKTVKLGKSFDHFQSQRLHKDGSLIDISISISPIRNAANEIIGASTIARDITHQKEIERRKDEFLSIASHELKTPVTSIKAYAQILEKYFLAEDESQCLAISQRMNRQIDLLSQLVYDLLDISRIELGQIKFNQTKMNIYSLLQDSIEDVQPLTNHQIKLKGEKNIQIFADEYRLSQVMTNLLTNAIKYSPSNSDIIVKLEQKKEMVQVSVQDFGIGIPPEHFEQLFNRFYKVDSKDADSYGGLGLGLYISSQIIVKQGGKMWVESQPSVGSTFFFSLPIADDQSKTSKLRKNE